MLAFFSAREIFLSIGTIDIRWYGLTYVLGYAIMYILSLRLQRYRGLALSREKWLGVTGWAALGVLLGGRLGYVLFYEPGYYWQHLGQVFTLSQGGMSAHGGILGAILGLYIAACIYQLSFWRVADIAVVPAGIGLALGRAANFINQEIYGTVTVMPWGITIPGAEGMRHPWPLYEAVTNLCLATVAYCLLQRRQARPGLAALAFIMSYSLIRFVLEYIRAPERPPLFLGNLVLTRGQLLSAVCLAVFGLVAYCRRQKLL